MSVIGDSREDELIRTKYVLCWTDDDNWWLDEGISNEKKGGDTILSDVVDREGEAGDINTCGDIDELEWHDKDDGEGLRIKVCNGICE